MWIFLMRNKQEKSKIEMVFCPLTKCTQKQNVERQIHQDKQRDRLYYSFNQNVQGESFS